MITTRDLALLAASVALLGLIPLSAQGAACAGFTDIDSTSDVCANVEWLKNRSITRGCSSSALYCPNDPVNRLQAAAFMHRLSTALTPIDLPTAVDNLWDVDLATPPVMCRTADFPVTSFPRRAFLRAMAGLSGPWGDIDLAVELVYSTNGGANWTTVPDSTMFQTVYIGGPIWDAKAVVPFGALDLAVGSTYRFALRMSAVNSTESLVTLHCAVAVQVGNRSAALPPF